MCAPRVTSGQLLRSITNDLISGGSLQRVQRRQSLPPSHHWYVLLHQGHYEDAISPEHPIPTSTWLLRYLRAIVKTFSVYFRYSSRLAIRLNKITCTTHTHTNIYNTHLCAVCVIIKKPVCFFFFFNVWRRKNLEKLSRQFSLITVSAHVRELQYEIVDPIRNSKDEGTYYLR